MERVFITGASSGIGAALARAYSARGAIVGLAARRETELRDLAETLPGESGVFPVDVRDAGSLSRAAENFTARFGTPDVVIANAGVSHGTLTDDASDLSVFAEIMDINVIGIVRTFQPFMRGMRKAKSGKLVGIASVAGFRGLPGASAYSASKAAAISYLESLRVEMRGSGVAVVTLCPGYIATPLTTNNPYPMPFILPVEKAAKKMIVAVDRTQKFTVIPWQMAVVGKIMRCLPNGLYDTLASKAGRKPRKTSI
ncbi:MAG: SDR family oxidoreductase [Burkholderiales bacterium]